jgi:hypothetical protein
MKLKQIMEKILWWLFPSVVIIGREKVRDDYWKTEKEKT